MDGSVVYDEPMSRHTTFKVGGPADIFATPENEHDVEELLRFSREAEVPCFVLGGGANILVADAGIRGMVIDMSRFNRIRSTAAGGTTHLVEMGAGLPISAGSAWAADHGLGGLEFIYAMPGSVAGAVWMNARCYDGEISDVLAFVDYFEPDGARTRYRPVASDFSYKRSPFQDRRCVMTGVGFSLHDDDRERLWAKMRAHERDRTAKGHFAAPCAGSIFKNNRDFGAPSGAIIDGLGLRGYAVGGARISERHANIIINTGAATAADIRAAIEHVARVVHRERGFTLEPEILYVGDWASDEQ